jgi:hypothetical protein
MYVAKNIWNCCKGDANRLFYVRRNFHKSTIMIKYSYTIENTTIETLNLSEVPNGLPYETIEFEIEIEQEVTPPSLTVNEVIIDLVTRQVEVMSDAEKSELLTLLK